MSSQPMLLALLAAVLGAGALALLAMAMAPQPPKPEEGGRRLAPAKKPPTGQAARRLSRAGVYLGGGPALLLVLQVVIACLGGLLGLTLAEGPLLLSGSASLGVAVISAALGYAAPSVLLRALGWSRSTTLQAALPDFADVLVLCLEGGMGVDAAVQRAAAELQAPAPELADELQRTLRHWERGDDPAVELRAVAERTGSKSLAELLRVVQECRSQGTAVAEALREQADGLRLDATAERARRAKQLPLQVLVLLSIFVLPAAFALLLGPSLLQAMRSLSELG